MYTYTQNFTGIGLLEAASGEVVLRGRQGERDYIIPLERSVEKYWHTIEVMHRYAFYGVRGWDTLADIADDLKHKITEAVEQRNRLGLKTDPGIIEFISDNIQQKTKPLQNVTERI